MSWDRLTDENSIFIQHKTRLRQCLQSCSTNGPEELTAQAYDTNNLLEAAVLECCLFLTIYCVPTW